jgi:hypothetical protein
MQLNGDPATKKPIMASFVETAIKDYFAASKFLRRTLEAPKPDKGEYVDERERARREVQHPDRAVEHDAVVTVRQRSRANNVRL